MSQSIHRSVRIAAAAAALGALALAPSASAATITPQGNNRLTYAAGAGETNNLTASVDLQANRITFSETGRRADGGQIPIGLSGGCTSTQPGIVSCPLLSVLTVDIELGDQADTFSAAGAIRNFDIDAGPGADTVRGGEVHDTFEASGRAAADEYFGGPGSDEISYADRNVPLNVTLDDVANDGASGEGDNAHSDIEVVVGGHQDDTITGSDASNELDGGDGNDVLEGLGGFDRLRGQGGFDTLRSRDGLHDDVDCGSQTVEFAPFEVNIDAAFIDLPDTVNHCFFVDRAAKEHGPGVAIARRTLREDDGAAKLRLTCPADPAAGCSGALRLERLNRRGRTGGALGDATYSLAAGKRGVIKITLNRRARRLLARDDRLLVRATSVEKDDQGRDKTTYATLVLKVG
jgi:Ca2+-binding RTX toxin-like protein